MDDITSALKDLSKRSNELRGIKVEDKTDFVLLENFKKQIRYIAALPTELPYAINTYTVTF